MIIKRYVPYWYDETGELKLSTFTFATKEESKTEFPELAVMEFSADVEDSPQVLRREINSLREQLKSLVNQNCDQADRIRELENALDYIQYGDRDEN